MAKLQETRRFRRALYSKITIAILILVGLFFIKAIWSSWQKYSITADGRAGAAIQLRELKTQKEELEKELEELRGKSGQEAVLRDRFDVGMPGEEVIKIIDREE